jgi:hypothetical protein
MTNAVFDGMKSVESVSQYWYQWEPISATLAYAAPIEAGHAKHEGLTSVLIGQFSANTPSTAG